MMRGGGGGVDGGLFLIFQIVEIQMYLSLYHWTIWHEVDS